MKQSNEKLASLRHSAAHLLAAAVMELWPDTKRTIGPAIEDGFYYDFEFSKPLSESDLPKIEKKMHNIVQTWKGFERHEVTAAEAKKENPGNHYKAELIDEFTKEGQKLTVYQSGNFRDLCRGGHCEHPSKELKHFKLMSLAGAYWRGSEKNAMLTRIYGTIFPTKEELEQHLKNLEEAKKRDHRKLGKELDLFALIDEVGPGLPLFYPKGATMRHTIEDFIAETQEKKGYASIWIPHITKGKLYEISGHLDKYDAMYPPMDLEGETQYYLKPMNCPHFMMLYKSKAHSYRELPIRWTCTTTNYRYEKSGELTGLTRVRSLTQDDCHVFCTEDQIGLVVNEMLDMVEHVYAAFGLKDFWVRISAHDPKNIEKYIGDPKIWHASEKKLEELIKDRNWKYETAVGEAAFYGPKLDFIFKDVLGREWQLSTIQLDMNLPEKFDLEYATAEGKARPVVIHRALLGSTERFMAILIEHYGGSFPLWLSPIQVRIVSVGEKHIQYCQNIAKLFRAAQIRCDVDESAETIGNKVRKASNEKIPYTLVIGDKEIESKELAIRIRGEKDVLMMETKRFIESVAKKSFNRSPELKI